MLVPRAGRSASSCGVEWIGGLLSGVKIKKGRMHERSAVASLGGAEEEPCSELVVAATDRVS